MHKLVEWSHQVYAQRLGQNILLPVGCDFSFQNAFLEYNNLEKLIDYANAHNKYNIEFRMSTPSEYLAALKKEHLKFPVATGDGIPYADREHDYWTGYYTSRPGSKKQVRDGSALLHAEQQLFARAMLSEDDETQADEILAAQRVMLEQVSTYLHHDGITGTEKQFVALDYTRRLGQAIEQSRYAYASLLAQDVEAHSGISLSKIELCTTWSQNETAAVCPISFSDHRKADNFLVIVHNPASIAYD